MNIRKLKDLEFEFFKDHPEGFDGDEFSKISKRHNIEKRTKYVHETCTPDNLSKGSRIYKEVAKVVTSSSMVSVFEKMRFRDLANDLSIIEKLQFVDGVNHLLHGNEKKGFYMLVSVLEPYKLAKWTIISSFLAYNDPQYQVFMKPTTIKKILHYLEIEDIKYTPKPDYGFYKKYREYINEMKMEVDFRVRPNNPAFTGFLMMML